MEAIKKRESSSGIENLIGILLLIYVFIPFSSTIKLVAYTILAGISILFLKLNRLTADMSKCFALLMICTVWIFIGSLYTPQDQSTAANKLVFRFIVSLLLSLCWISSGMDGERLKKWLVTIGNVCVLATLAQMILPGPMGELSRLILDSESYKNYTQSLSYYNSYYGICTTSYENALYISYAFFGNMISFTKNHKKFKYFIGIVLSLITLFATQKRSIILCTIACTVLYSAYVILRRKTSPTIKGVYIFGLAFVFLFGFFFINFTEVGHTLSERLFVDIDSINLSQRDIMFETMWEKSQDSLLVGHGTASAYSIYSIGVHNIYLQLLYENGIIGIVLFLVLFATVFIKTWRKNLFSANKDIYEFSLLCQILFIAYGLSGNTIYYSNTLMLYTLYVCMAGHVDLEENISDENLYTDLPQSR